MERVTSSNVMKHIYDHLSKCIEFAEIYVHDCPECDKVNFNHKTDYTGGSKKYAYYVCRECGKRYRWKVFDLHDTRSSKRPFLLARFKKHGTNETFHGIEFDEETALIALPDRLVKCSMDKLLKVKMDIKF